jgi:hypothetical protein
MSILADQFTQDILGAFDSWNFHHNGVDQAIQARGGLQAIDKNQALRLTVSWYVSVVSTCISEQPC